ncbi:SDR family oxidoreductase [Quadrisphaera sp. DSM 44207]|uniref:SDR family NAD(P)-dependent oxidoreductase n=1 Tax=Quadrisphaera sp. DSM 44207 TaxID=1881057 RepID=UPI0021017DFA|nr:SDR family NAD(P)-dependent oxidoreductase [Quadrisphaera sp. DSM 44207]
MDDAPTALVTGASAGLGLAFARALAARGHDLVLVARDAARLEALAADLRAQHGAAVQVLPADLADREALAAVAERAGSASRPVDLLVNNAGFGLRQPVVGGDVREHERALDVMCRAVLVLSAAAATAMRERGRGAVVNVSSVAGWTAMGTYAAAKAWTTTFTEGLAGELRGTGVSATALCPGFVRTEFHARMGEDTSGSPAWAWLDADAVVEQALADAGRGAVVSVPSRRYALAALGLRLAPRPLVRAASGGVGARRAPWPMGRDRGPRAAGS